MPNHLVWGILTTLLCCWPFGVVAIVYATKVESRRAEGDIEGAWEASRKARLWALWSAGSVGIAVVVGIAFAVITEMTR
nr:CD225/dispanin family protein [Pseudoxanthomonas composti]